MPGRKAAVIVSDGRRTTGSQDLLGKLRLQREAVIHSRLRFGMLTYLTNLSYATPAFSEDCKPGFSPDRIETSCR